MSSVFSEIRPAAIALLRRAIDRMRTGFATGAMALDKRDRPVSPHSETACKWSIRGAVIREGRQSLWDEASGETTMEVQEALDLVQVVINRQRPDIASLHHLGIRVFQNDPATTLQASVAVVEEALRIEPGLQGYGWQRRALDEVLAGSGGA